jgi:hypothetical protein
VWAEEGTKELIVYNNRLLIIEYGIKQTGTIWQEKLTIKENQDL